MGVMVDAAGRPREIRWSARRKAAVVLRVLAGAPIDRTASEVGVGVAVVLRWRDEFIAAGTEGLKGRRPLRGGDR